MNDTVCTTFSVSGKQTRHTRALARAYEKCKIADSKERPQYQVNLNSVNIFVVILKRHPYDYSFLLYTYTAGVLNLFEAMDHLLRIILLDKLKF